jgi:hypothetical protein
VSATTCTQHAYGDIDSQRSGLTEVHLGIPPRRLPPPDLLLSSTIKEHPRSNGTNDEKGQEKEVFGRRRKSRISLEFGIEFGSGKVDFFSFIDYIFFAL